jgi:hypothetical protein
MKEIAHFSKRILVERKAGIRRVAPIAFFFGCNGVITIHHDFGFF